MTIRRISFETTRGALDVLRAIAELDTDQHDRPVTDVLVDRVAVDDAG